MSRGFANTGQRLSVYGPALQSVAGAAQEMRVRFVAMPAAIAIVGRIVATDVWEAEF
jgi:hypothetical protein